MATIQELTAIGKEMGLSGDALKGFVTEQQTLAREERAQQRAHEQEKQRRNAEKEAHESEERERQRQADVEKQRLDLEREKIKLEIHRATSKAGSRNGSTTGHEEDDVFGPSDHNNSGRSGSGKLRGPKMTPFDDKDEIDSYMHRFEQYAMIQKWGKSNWAVYLAALLRGKALDVYARLPPDQANDYSVLKDALLRRYNKTEEGYKQQFHTCKAEAGESAQQFIVRLASYLAKWIDLAKVAQTFEGLVTLMVREQFLATCTKDLEVFLRERAITDLDELAKLAQQYLDAHKHSSLSGTPRATNPSTPKPANTLSKPSQPDSMTPKRCYNCNRLGHIAKNCRQPIKAASAETEMEAELDEAAGVESAQSKPQYSRQYSGNYNNYNSRHQSYAPRQQSQTSATGQVNPPKTEPTSSKTITCKAHSSSDCRECFNIVETPRHPACNALLVDHVELKCGCTLPIIADACQASSTKINMPTAPGYVNRHPVTVLRDSGCSTIIVRRSLVSPDAFTGRDRTCVLIDGTLRTSPTAKINIDTPFLKGEVIAVCMNNPLYDLIVGNVPGVSNISNEITQAVVTRGMAIKQKQPLQPLPTSTEIDIEVTRPELIQLQHEDPKLKSIWSQLPSQNLEVSLSEGRSVYIVKSELLYRKTQDERGRVCTQFIVPSAKLREKVMKLAHESALSGHQGINRTRHRIFTQFWWPDLSADVARHCRSCDICQRTINKGRVRNVPLGSMPIIDTPFERIAVDLIGPISPVSDRGHRYILTVVDYATRYPEASALKDIQTETVAEALVDIFTRVGVPKEVLSDQGSQFVSAIMKEVSRLLSIKQLVISPYHPMCNGLVERFNGTIKTMLKRVCNEKPKDWDRYISSVLFAYREVRQESLGYSPFELLYGRTVRGPMSILRELWTKEQVEPDVKTTYQYVVDLQNRLQETCSLAAEELKKAQMKQIKWFNKRTSHREFKVGSKVLILRPTDHNKLLMQWKGPYEVLEHVRDYNYRINIKGKPRTYHANMLKQYVERNTPEEVGMAMETSDPTVVEEMASAILDAEVDDAEIHTFQPCQKETLTDVDINPELSETQKEEVKQLLQEFSDVFTDIPNCTDLGEHQIKLTSQDPVYQKPYPLPFALRETLSKEIDDMLKLNVIEPSTSAYASPVVMVKKPDGSTRVCVDFRQLNKITVFDPEPMPTAEDIFVKLSNDRYFSKFDLSKGYWQVPMKETDKQYTSFTTHRGMFQFRVMPFGLVNAPATFSRIMRKVLQAAQDLDNYLDDVLAHTRDWNQHLLGLRDLFTRLRKAKLAIRPTKCSIGYNRVEFLGFRVGDNQLQPISSKVDKVIHAPRPETKAQLRSFLGLVNYYRKFIPDFAAIAVPLTDMTKKNTPNTLIWESAQEKAFNTLRNFLVNPPVLHLPDLQKHFILQTDACKQGLGAVLLQEHDGIRYPVSFASRKLLPREQNYSTIEQECLAIVWAIQKFSNYLCFRHFLLETDHQPLQYLNRSRYQNGRLMRWALELQPYRFTVIAIKGSQNVGADFLSRHAI